MDRFLIKRISLENLREVNELVKQHFSPREPWGVALKAPVSEVACLDQVRAERNLHDDAAVGVFLADNDQLVGCCVNSIEPAINTFQTKHLDEELQKLAVKYDWLKCMIRLEEILMENMWQELGAKKFLLTSLATVDEKFARRGLLTKMLIENEAIAREHGCDFVTSICSSSFSGKACQKLGHTLYKSVDLYSYVDGETGKLPFNEIDSPHAECCFFYKPVTPKLASVNNL